jgi:hypothetical protein
MPSLLQLLRPKPFMRENHAIVDQRCGKLSWAASMAVAHHFMLFGPLQCQLAWHVDRHDESNGKPPTSTFSTAVLSIV